jgi:hypothetical protein
MTKGRVALPLIAVIGIESAQVCGTSLGHSWQMKVEVRSIPHLAKNERDVGHPRVRDWDGSEKVTGSLDDKFVGRINNSPQLMGLPEKSGFEQVHHRRGPRFRQASGPGQLRERQVTWNPVSLDLAASRVGGLSGNRPSAHLKGGKTPFRARCSLADSSISLLDEGLTT